MPSHSYSKDHLVSWEEFHDTAKTLSLKLLPLGPWKGIIAITRGGLLPAGIVATELDIRLIDTLCISSYQKDDSSKDEKIQGELRLLKTIEGNGEGMLLIDDLVDTGKTAVYAKKLLPKAHLASLYAKPTGQTFADTFVTEINQNIWIHFPWDKA